MSQHRDLLEQAVTLAKIDVKKPKQASLRRAISSAYYAVFHLLVDEACRVQIGTHHTQAPFRQVLGRAFGHGVMKDACRSFGGGTLKKGVAKGLPGGFSIPGEIKELAAAFVDIQESRHLADYDLTERFKRSEVLALIEEARKHCERFRRLDPVRREAVLPRLFVGLEGTGEPLRLIGPWRSTKNVKAASAAAWSAVKTRSRS